MVYFISDGNCIKIGNSRDVSKRIMELQTGNPSPLEFVEAVKGGLGLEKEVHRYFNDYLVQGEWFSVPVDVIKDFIGSFRNRIRYINHSEKLCEIKENNFKLTDYRLWEFILYKQKNIFRFSYDDISHICSRGAYFRSKKLLLSLNLIKDIEGRDMFKINTTYIKYLN